MKKEILFVLFLFLISNCFAQELNFQRENYSPSETILGNISNVLSEIISSDLKIYEGRREVFFEKGIIKFNGSYYFYLIPTKQGEFSIRISNVLYNNSGEISSVSFEKYFNISQRNNSMGFGVRPGVYEGDKPEIVITNLKEGSLNLTIDKQTIVLVAGESKRIELNVSEGFSMYKLGNYTLPIINTKSSENIANVSTNESKENTSFSEMQKCLIINTLPFFSLQINVYENYTIELKNNCSDLIEIKLSADYEGVSFNQNNITLEKEETKNIVLTLFGEKSGEYKQKITFSEDKNILAEKEISIYFFENKTSLEAFNQTYVTNTPQNCSSLGGKFCKSGEKCSTENIVLDSATGDFCCIGNCIDPNAKPINWANVLFSILGLLVISYIIYVLLNRSKNLKAPKAEDKFKEAEKKYEQKFESVKKSK